MKILITGIVLYSILGICYAIDFFHSEYEDMVQDQGTNIGEFFVLTIVTAFMWPMMIVINAFMDLRGER